MVILAVLAVLVLLALTYWWLSESRQGRFTEKPDEAVRRAQHRDG